MLKKLIKHSAFTMAEILLSLTIIGVVAAITLPSLTGNINERTWNTQRKALFSRLSQSVALMEGIRGYGTISVGTNGDRSWQKVYSSDTATEAFLTAGLGKVLKMNNICNHNNLSDCGLPPQITTIGGGGKISLSALRHITGLNSKYSGGNDTEGTSGIGYLGAAVSTYAAAFETANGESVLVHYNPICKPNQHAHHGANTSTAAYEPIATMCANFIYDLNGKKGPNTIGKDMGFMTLFFPSDPLVVAPMPHNNKASSSATQSEAARICRNLDDSRLPTKDEMASITINKSILGTVNSSNTTWEQFNSELLWTATKANAGTAYFLHPRFDTLYTTSTSTQYSVRCVKRDN